MKITPIDIEKHQFKGSLRGYNKKEVDSFLKEISNELTKLIEDNRMLSDRIKELTKVQKDYRDMEQDLKDTLLTAQKLQSDIQSTAKKEADNLLRETKLKCNEQIQKTEKTIEHYQNSIKQLKIEKSKILSGLKNMMQEYYAVLEEFSKEETAKE